MIPVEVFHSPPPIVAANPTDARNEEKARAEEKRILGPEIEEMRKRAKRAIAKAAKVKPPVRKLLRLSDPITRHYYAVEGKTAECICILFRDRDLRWWLDCTCPAGNPPADKERGAIRWHPQPCYHGAAVLIHFSKTVQATQARRHKNDGDHSANQRPRRNSR